MGFLDKFFKKDDNQPEDYYKVIVTDVEIKVERHNFATESVLWNDLHTVHLINTDQGPSQPDVWLILTGYKSQCKIPQGSDGFEKVYDIVSKFDGFKFDNFIKSMSCTDNAELQLWTKIN